MCDADMICPLLIACLSSASLILNSLALKNMKSSKSKKRTFKKSSKVFFTPDGVDEEI